MNITQLKDKRDYLRKKNQYMDYLQTEIDRDRFYKEANERRFGVESVSTRPISEFSTAEEELRDTQRLDNVLRGQLDKVFKYPQDREKFLGMLTDSEKREFNKIFPKLSYDLQVSKSSKLLSAEDFKQMYDDYKPTTTQPTTTQPTTTTKQPKQETQQETRENRCKGVTQSGKKCKRIVDSERDDYCYQHQDQDQSRSATMEKFFTPEYEFT